MWRRLLVAIGAAHRAGVIHGAVLPEHVLIHPAEHGLVLVDWCYSVSGPAAGPGHRAALPALVPARGPGGRPGRPDDWTSGSRPGAWPSSSAAGRRAGWPPSPRGCLLASPGRRPQDAWRLLAEFDELLERLYGPRRFRPFAMPALGENTVRRTTMGSGRWSTNVYDAAARFRAATGASAFAYSDGGATRGASRARPVRRDGAGEP